VVAVVLHLGAAGSFGAAQQSYLDEAAVATATADSGWRERLLPVALGVSRAPR
jgi:hypothetical protein